MKIPKILVGLVLFIGLGVSSYLLTETQAVSAQTQKADAAFAGHDDLVPGNSQRVLKEGQHTFRFDTFGDEAWWGDTLHLHEAIEGTKLGGIGPGVSPATALSLGLKVDLDALPPSLVEQIKMGKVNLNDPAVTLTLLQLSAVVGVTGHSNADGSLKSVGIQCALCHSTVDNALAPGIGHRLDGWANRDLNVGAIIAQGDARCHACLLNRRKSTLKTRHYRLARQAADGRAKSVLPTCSDNESEEARTFEQQQPGAVRIRSRKICASKPRSLVLAFLAHQFSSCPYHVCKSSPIQIPS